MKISVGDVEYLISDEQRNEILTNLQEFALSKYADLKGELRFAAKAGARHILQDQENKARATHGNESAMIFRPEKKEDAVVHLTKVTVLILQELLKDVEICFTTDANTITSIGYAIANQSESGGSMATHGNIRLGQNNGSEVS